MHIEISSLKFVRANNYPDYFIKQDLIIKNKEVTGHSQDKV